MKKIILPLLAATIGILMYCSTAYTKATKLVWDKPNFRCGDICNEAILGYKVYVCLDGNRNEIDPNNPRKIISDPNVLDVQLADLDLISGRANNIVLVAFKRFGSYEAKYNPKDPNVESIVWEDIPPGEVNIASSTPEKGILAQGNTQG